MVKLKTLPSLAVIKSLAGVIDFYVDKGQPIARTWPKKTKVKPTKKMTCNQQRFRTFQKGLQCWNNPLRELHYWACQPSGWTWRDYGYKCYMGTVKYAPRYLPPEVWHSPKPCPDEIGLFFLVHHAYISCKRVSDYPSEPWEGAGLKRYLVAVEFWVDQGNLQLELVYDFHPPPYSETWRKQRGEMKFCANEPLPFRNPRHTDIDNCYYNELPWVCHGFPISHYSAPAIEDTFFGYLQMSPNPYPWWTPRHAYSVSPMFKFHMPILPHMEIGQTRYHHLEPLHPIHWGSPDYKLLPWGWMTWNCVWRSPLWPAIDWEPPPTFQYRQEPWYRSH